MRLSERPAAYIAMNVDTIDAGIAIMTISEFLTLWRNTSMTSATRTTATARSSFTAFTASSVNVEPSCATSNLTFRYP